MPKGLLMRLHPVQILVFICRAKQPHGLRRIVGFRVVGASRLGLWWGY